MMRTRLFFSLVVIVLVFAPVLGVEQRTFDRVYVSNTMGFAFHYPDGWRVMPECDGYVVLRGSLNTDTIRMAFHEPQLSSDSITEIQNDETAVDFSFDGRDYLLRTHPETGRVDVLITLDETRFGVVTATVLAPESLDQYELYLFSIAETYTVMDEMQEPTTTQAQQLLTSFESAACETVALGD